jgi:hypothetical protein
MKKLIVTALPVFFLLVFAISCQQEENTSPTLGKATFSLSPKARGNGRVGETTTPAFVLLSIKYSSGKVVEEDKKLPLFPFGQGYLSESIELPTGTYQLTKFAVLDAANKVIYATPLEGSDLAKYVADPLPIEFLITENGVENVVPQVLEVTPDDIPESFGYVSFGFEIIKKTRLDYYTQSYNLDGLGFSLNSKVVYEYNDSGSLRKYTAFRYNSNTNIFEAERYLIFSYASNRVEYIKGYRSGHNTPYVEYSYQYLANGDVSKITEKNQLSGLNSEANFAYAENGSVKVSYMYFNGRGFEYEFDYTGGNILTDKTTQGSQLCSEGQYTYDSHNSPFKNLGYVDYLLTNLSVNNRLTNNINYVACSFPSLEPVSYAYEYNDNGYPISATTSYKNPQAKSKKEFFYIQQ